MEHYQYQTEGTTFSGTDRTQAIYDDKSFSSENDGITLISRPVGMRYDHKYVNDTTRMSRKMLSVWRVVSVNGLGPLIKLDSTSTSLLT